MIRSADSGCELAALFLAGAPIHEMDALSRHLLECAKCQALFQKQPEKLDALFQQPSSPLPIDVLAEANRRIDHARSVGSFCSDLPTPTIPGFELGRLLHQNRHSRIYFAKQLDIGRPVVIKCVCNNISTTDYRILEQEGKTLGALNHPNILKVFQTGRLPQCIWLALEFFPQGSLSQHLGKDKTLGPKLAAQMVSKIALAVSAAHQSGVIHSDIKPANILMANNGEPMLADFGLSRNEGDTQEGWPHAPVAGTPSFMAPEQVRREIPDVRTDIHGLGLILYYLLVGKSPFKGDTPYKVMLEVAHTLPISPDRIHPDIPRDLAAICMKCLAKAPGDRYQSAHALAQDLDQFLADQPVQARRWGRLETALRWMGRNQLTSAAIFFSAMALVFSAALLSFLGMGIYREKEKAIHNQDLALQYLEKSDSQSYTSGVKAALFQMESGYIAAANALLTELPFSRRGWEHHYITGRLRDNQFTILEHSDSVLSLAIRPDRKEFVTVSADRSVRLWDAENGKLVKTLLGGSHPYVNVTWSADMGRIGVVDSEGWIRVMDAKTGVWSTVVQVSVERETREELRRIPLALSSDGSVVYCRTDSRCVGEWSITTGKLLRTFPAVHTNTILRIFFDPGRKLLASSGKDNKVLLWDQESGRLLRELTGSEKEIHALAFSPDGKTLAGGGKDLDVHLWSVDTGKKLLTLKGHEDWVTSINFDPAGKRIASASEDHTIRVWDVQNGEPLNTLRGHLDFVNSVRFSGDGKRLITTSSDHTIKIWNSKLKQGLKELPHPDWIRGMAFSPDGKFLATTGEDDYLRLWSVPDAALLRQIRIANRRMVSLRFSPDGTQIGVGGFNSQIDLFKTQDLTLAGRLVGHQGAISSFCYTPDGLQLFSLGSDGNIGQWDMTSLTLKKMDHLGIQNPKPITVSPDGKWFAVASGLEIQVRATEDWRLHRELQGHSKLVLDLAFSPDSQKLASSSDDRDILIWDLETGELKHRMEGHQGGVPSIHFSPDGTRLLSSSFDRSINLWDPNTGRQIIGLHNHRAGVRRALFSPDGQWIASAGDDNRVFLWDGTARMEDCKVRQFKSLADLREIVDANNRSIIDPEGLWPPVKELIGPQLDKGVSISRDGTDYFILDRHARAARLAREQKLLQSWK